MAKVVRRSARRGLGTRAWIRPDQGFSVRECTVADVSANGVQVRLEQAHKVSERFGLQFSRDGAARPCRVRWRRGTQIGAEFLKQA